MAYESVVGTVSHAGERVTVRGGRRATSSKVTTSFRLDSTPVDMEGPADVGDGDIVTAVGERKGGKLQAYILRNESTGALYNELTGAQYGFVGVGIALSILLMPVVIGFAMAPFMAWYAYKLYRVKKAQDQLRSSPPPVASPT